MFKIIKPFLLIRLKLSIKSFIALSFLQMISLNIEIDRWERSLFWLPQYRVSFFINFLDAVLDERFRTILLINSLYDDL